jgi:hypothetical protein
VSGVEEGGSQSGLSGRSVVRAAAGRHPPAAVDAVDHRRARDCGLANHLHGCGTGYGDLLCRDICRAAATGLRVPSRDACGAARLPCLLVRVIGGQADSLW